MTRNLCFRAEFGNYFDSSRKYPHLPPTEGKGNSEGRGGGGPKRGNFRGAGVASRGFFPGVPSNIDELLINNFSVELQWGTKVLGHFPKMVPFCIVDRPIPFPCLPQPLPPKINVAVWTLKSFFYFRQHWFGGWGDLQRLKGMKL